MSKKSDTTALNALQEDLTAGRINRRDFLAGATALGVSLSAANALLATPARAAPKKGGRLRLGVSDGAIADSSDPATTSTMAMILQNHTTRNYLAEISPENTLVPELAESWESSQDAATWVFKLRRDVEFHNGKTMDVQDVLDSINHHRKEDSTSAAKALLDAIEDIRADGPNAFTVNLKTGNADFPYVFTDYHLNILPSDGAGGVDWQSGVGTGAYVLKAFEPGVRSKYVRNPNYWKENRANFEEGEVLVISDANSRQTALISNQVDVMDQPSLKTVAHMAEEPDIALDNVTGWAHTSMPMHMDVPPYDDPDVRMALKLGIDREEVVNKVLKGYGTVGNDHPISPVIEYHADLEQRVYDPDKAKHHLRKADLADLSVSLSTSDGAGAGNDDTALLFKEQAARAGITVDVVREPADGYWSNVWLKKPFCMVNWGGRPTADVMFTTAYAEGAPWNDSHFSNERFNQLLVAARGETDTALRSEMYREMQIILRDEGSTIIPAFKNLVYLRRANVQHGPALSANWQFDGARAIERWWLA